ncbi:MAG TPA: dihydropteroate synthase [Blastocatellia bacterium]|nr:dihydropteroate synthase [Blastocatellia bacterium]
MNYVDAWPGSKSRLLRPWNRGVLRPPAAGRYLGTVSTQYTVTLGNGRTLRLGDRTILVGVVNVTPDSFSDGGLYYEAARAVDRAFEIEAAGAGVIEIGGESTRPGAAAVGVTEEMDRVVPVLERLNGRIRVPVSVDTCKSEVARAAIELGACIINDVSALRVDPEIASVAAEMGTGLVLMHMRGTPANMQKLEPSPDIFEEINRDLTTAVAVAERAGVGREQIILDPGIGFGKTVEQNVSIINHLNRIAELGFPLMVGTSRKSFLGRLTGKPEHQRRFATAASAAAAILRGAHMIRVHDVEDMIDVVQVADAIVKG